MSGREKLAETINQVAELAETIAAPLGLAIVDVKFGQTGKRRTLEVTIHRRDGSVSLDDCEAVSRSLEKALDESAANDQPLIEGSYLLEVQSPGIERQLKTEREFRAFIGHPVLVQTKEKVSQLGHSFTGTLYGIESDNIVLTGVRAYPAKPAATAQARVVVTKSEVVIVKLHSEKDFEQNASTKGRTHDHTIENNN
jgi:ribosome maturation factor RimP